MADVIRLQRKDSDDDRLLTFRSDFRIGRDPACDLTIDHASVSREHLLFFLQGDRWWIRDLGSTNGTYLDGIKIEMLPVADNQSLEIGKNGPRLIITTISAPMVEESDDSHATPPSRQEFPHPGKTTHLETTSGDEPQEMTPELQERYFGEAEPENMGERTMIIRREYQNIRKRQQSRTTALVCGALAIVLVLGGYAWHTHQKVQASEILAEETFYEMQEMNLQIANLRHELTVAGISLDDQLKKLQQQQNKISNRYDQWLDELGIYQSSLSYEDSLILNVTRKFGECEINMPDDYVSEVKRFIGYWKSSNRFENAIKRAQRHDFARRTKEIMLGSHLPPEFFYLALQESNFNPQTVGPSTSYGYAKGIWQFIPKTARKYGLKTGPLVDQRRYDPRDERFDFDKACSAAARYINDIYRTECQASGLLVMASYNWGEHNILARLRTLPESPRERNFWKLLRDHKIPEETYHYVLYIISATVIGEDPRFFGFEFDNPLQS